LVPTKEPFLYNVSLTAMEGVSLDAVEEGANAEIERVRSAGVTEAEVARAKRQLRARLVFENDSVTNVAHQLGYFDTIVGPDFFDSLGAKLEAVTPADVAAVAARRLPPDGRTVGRFHPSERRS